MRANGAKKWVTLTNPAHMVKSKIKYCFKIIKFVQNEIKYFKIITFEQNKILYFKIITFGVVFNQPQ